MILNRKYVRELPWLHFPDVIFTSKEILKKKSKHFLVAKTILSCQPFWQKTTLSHLHSNSVQISEVEVKVTGLLGSFIIVWKEQSRHFMNSKFLGQGAFGDKP